MKKTSRIMITLLFVMSLLFVTNQAVLAAPIQDDTTPPGDNGGLEGVANPVLGFMQDITVSIIKFAMFLGGLIFVVTVVIAAVKSSVGTALGNQMHVSQGVMGLIAGFAALVLLLIAVPLANNLIQTLTTKFLPDLISKNGLALIDMQGGVAAGTISTNPQDMFQIPALQDTIIDIVLTLVRIMIGVGVLAFIIACVLGALDTQIGGLLGGSQMASRGIMRIIGAVGAVIFLLISFPLAKWIITAIVPKLLTGIAINNPFSG